MTPQEKLAKAKELLTEANRLVRDVLALGVANKGRKPKLLAYLTDTASDSIESAIADVDEADGRAL